MRRKNWSPSSGRHFSVPISASRVNCAMPNIWRIGSSSSEKTIARSSPPRARPPRPPTTSGGSRSRSPSPVPSVRRRQGCELVWQSTGELPGCRPGRARSCSWRISAIFSPVAAHEGNAGTLPAPAGGRTEVALYRLHGLWPPAQQLDQAIHLVLGEHLYEANQPIVTPRRRA